MEALTSEGLQLDLIEQMNELALQENIQAHEPSINTQAHEPSINKKTPPPVFQKETPSTKVGCYSTITPPPHHHRPPPPSSYK